MNETYYQDTKGRRCYSHKVNGSKSKRCTLPSDHLTAAQKAALNGEPETISLKRPMTLEQLRTVNHDLQSIYLHHLVDDLHARREDLSSMLQCSPWTVTNLLKQLPEPIQFKPGRQPPVSPEWLAFIGGADPDPAPEEPAPDPEPREEPIPDSPRVETECPLSIQSGQLTYHCTVPALLAALHLQLPYLIDPKTELEFTLSFEA